MPSRLMISWFAPAVVPLGADRRAVLTWWGLTVLLAGLLALLLLLVLPRARRRLADLLTDHGRLAATLAVLTCALGIFAWRQLVIPQARQATSPPATIDLRPGAPWPMDRGGLSRLGAVGRSPGPTAAQRAWTHALAAEACYASPCVVGNRIYTVASREDNGRILGLDADSGRQVWSTAPPGYRATFSSPVVHGDLLLCGEGLHAARRARLVAIDVRAGHEGSLLWTFSTNGHIECTPTISEGRAYFGAGDDGIYCLKIAQAASAGERVNPPELVFHLSGRDYPDAETSLAVHAGRLYVGLGIGGNALCVLDAQTGRELKRIALPYPVFSPPAIDGRHLFLGLGDANYARPGDASEGQVACLDLESLEVRWTLPLPGAVLGAVAVDTGELFWGCGDGHVYRMRLADRSVASYRTGAAIAASVAVTPTTVFAVNEAGTLVALERATWAPRFQCQLGEPGRYVSSPVVFGERLVVGTPSSGLVCLGRPSQDAKAD